MRHVVGLQRRSAPSASYARDRRTGTTTASNFHDAVTLRHMIDNVTATCDAFFT